MLRAAAACSPKPHPCISHARVYQLTSELLSCLLGGLRPTAVVDWGHWCWWQMSLDLPYGCVADNAGCHCHPTHPCCLQLSFEGVACTFSPQ